MRFFIVSLRQAWRNMLFTWRSQMMTLFTVILSVLIFSFFYLIYFNAMNVGEKLDDSLRLVVYLEEDIPESLQEEYRARILKFDKVERIEFVSSEEAFQRFEEQLGPNSDILDGVPRNFLPPSIEVYPIRSLDTLSRISRFSQYLQSDLPALKVEYGKEWIERFYSFIQLMRVVIFLSGSLLIMTTTFMVAHTIHLTLLSRRRELELLSLVGATNNYIRMPFLIEGMCQGFFGAGIALVALWLLFNWINLQLAGPATIPLLSFVFLPWPILLIMVLTAVLLCATGSFVIVRRILHI